MGSGSIIVNPLGCEKIEDVYLTLSIRPHDAFMHRRFMAARCINASPIRGRTMHSCIVKWPQKVKCKQSRWNNKRINYTYN